MPKRKFFEIAAFPLTGPDVYRALLWLYSLIVLYAIASTLTGVPSIAVVAGPLYAFLWPAGLSVSSVVALIGVVRSRHTGKVRFEYAGTLALEAGLFGYFVAIMWRFLVYGDIFILPSALLPIMLGVFPMFRLLSILRRPHGGAPVLPATGEIAHV